MSTVTPSQQNIPGPTGGRQVNPSEVGWQFVPQYYTFVNKQPHRLHCFYTKNSTFINGTEGEDGKACYGQHEIHQKIQSLDYHDCKVFIHSVDAQSSTNNGIIIQVIGEMSNRSEPWKKFVQTFFLAEQPNGYFVLNDIFRFLKEDTAGDEDEGEETAHHETATAPTTTAVEEPPRFPEQHLPTAPVTAPVEQVVNSYEPEAPVPPPIPQPVTVPVVERSATPPAPVPAAVEEEHLHTNGVNGHAEHAESSVGEEDKNEDVAPAVTEPEPEPVEPITTAAEPPVSAAEAAAPTVKAPTPAPVAPPAAATPPTPAAASAAPTTPTAPPAPSGPKTWATLAASNNRKWGNQIATEAKGVSAAAPQTPAPAPAPPKPATNGKAASGPDTGAKVLADITTGQCFVKAVTENVNENVLRETLVSRFGPVKELEIVRSKACAFLEFASPEAARKAIQISLPIPQGGEGGIRLEGKPGPNGMPPRVIVETRKERGERPISTRGRGGPGGEGRSGTPVGGASAGEGGRSGQQGGGRGGRGSGSRGGRGAPPPPK
ncbi:hypothetical protein FRB95_001103 [Tulasnella sp. JGI-2019a]|nr:hypothetical protein FRB95_001103 [Tulasnella sp. JGI-2019a]